MPKFTNEVQHLVKKVLPWTENIIRSPLRNGVRLPVYSHRGARPQIAAALYARHRALLGRKRNRSVAAGYKPGYADQQGQARRWTGSKLDRDSVLREAVLERLAQGWSPEQVAGRFARDNRVPVISYETIYRFIHAQIARTKDYTWRHLPAARHTNAAGGAARAAVRRLAPMATCRPLSERPATAQDRRTPGHWERPIS